MYAYAGAYSGAYMGVGSGVGGLSGGSMTAPAAHHQVLATPTPIPPAAAAAAAAHTMTTTLPPTTVKRRTENSLKNTSIFKGLWKVVMEIVWAVMVVMVVVVVESQGRMGAVHRGLLHPCYIEPLPKCLLWRRECVR
ncbi:hypothetical protein E2C01_001116 [Portunus trituberculatus]|uniref:Uncharacterized protein n=1 Tax=Portunus trituberculatus TaxID=210409 RepID=A0A5B7CG44_PORTR|nr:hypothetical protein [Portunus trituberculatus]